MTFISTFFVKKKEKNRKSNVIQIILNKNGTYNINNFAKYLNEIKRLFLGESMKRLA